MEYKLLVLFIVLCFSQNGIFAQQEEVCDTSFPSGKKRQLNKIEKEALAIVYEQLEAYNNRDIEAFLDTYSEDIKVYTFPDKQNYKGKDVLREVYSGMFEVFTQLHCEILSEIVKGNKVTHEESVVFDNPDKPVHAVCTYIVKGGKIAEVYFYPDMEHEFDEGSSIAIQETTPEQLKGLGLLAKVWGFVKYYHPDVAKGKYQWDYELFHMLPKIIEAPNPTERNAHLTKWIKLINRDLSPDKMNTDPFDTTNCYVLPKLDWIHASALLGVELSAELNKIKNAERGHNHYYINADGDDWFKEEKQYPHIGWEDQGYRLLTLFRYWNAIEYCYPYKFQTDLEWDEVFTKHLPSFLWASSQSDYLKAIYALTAEINDSHGWLRSYDPYMYAAIFRLVEGELIVRKSYSCELKAGDVVLKIDGKNVGDIIEERKPYVSASNESRKLDFIVTEINKWDKNELQAEYVRENDTLSVLLTDFNLKEETPGCTSEIIPHNYRNELSKGSIIHLHISELSAESLTLIEDSLMASKGIILDCRGYPGDDSFYYKLSDLLLPDSFPYMEIADLDMKNPGVFRLTHIGSAGQRNPNAYKGRLVILVDETTQSAAETAVMMFQCVPNSITMGKQSSGTNGSIRFFPLPIGMDVIFTGQGCYYPNKAPIQRVGVKIDVPVSPSKELFLQGRDIFIEKAIAKIAH